MVERRGWLLMCVALGCGGEPAKPTPHPGIGPTVVLADVGAKSGLPAAAEPCLVFRDFDHDGRPDILVAEVDAQAQFTHQLGMHRNQGSLSFARSAIPVTGIGFVNCCAAADFDNDGWIDVALGGAQDNKPALVILRNTGTSGLEFTDVTGAAAAAIVTDAGSWIQALGFGDQDGDGLPELFVGYWGNRPPGNTTTCDVTATDFQCHWTPPAPTYAPLVLHNDQGKGFSSSSVATATPRLVNVFQFVDWDLDGRTDVFVSGDFAANAFLRNDKAGYTDLLPGWKANPYNHGMGAAFADFNHDGLWDFYVADAGPDQVYYGMNGAVADVAKQVGVLDATQLHYGWSPVAADLNNDGWIDLYVANTAITSNSDQLGMLIKLKDPKMVTAAPQGDFLFTNTGGESFDTTFIPNAGLEAQPWIAAIAIADADGDGLLDVAEVAYTGSSRVRLLHNETVVGVDSHWLEVELQTRAGSRDAIGAVIVLHDGLLELDRRPVGLGGPGNSADRVHFGLGKVTSVPSITVHWPGGAIQEIAGPIEVDRVLTIMQGP